MEILSMNAIMMRKILGVALASVLFTGCVSVKMEPKEVSLKAKEFNPPAKGYSGLYIFRENGLGWGLKKDIWVDGKCIGESTPNVFFQTVVEGNQQHEIATESEFSPNRISLLTEADKNYFIRQYTKLGVFIYGAGLEVVSEEEGKAAISKLDLASPGKCSGALNE
jgi:hypothetical protein